MCPMPLYRTAILEAAREYPFSQLTAAVIAFDGAQYLRAALPASWRVWVADGQIHVTDAAGRVRR